MDNPIATPCRVSDYAYTGGGGLVLWSIETADPDVTIDGLTKPQADQIVLALNNHDALKGIAEAYLKDLQEGRVYIESGTPEQIAEYDAQVNKVAKVLADINTDDEDE